MKITIESTDVLTTIDGVPVRLWEGTTDGGVPCRVFVRMIAVADAYDASEFNSELKRQGEPSEIKMLKTIPLREVLKNLE